MRRRLALAGLAVVLLLAAGLPSAAAHPRAVPVVPDWPPAPPAQWVGEPTWSLAAPIAMLVALLLATSGLARSRRVAAIAFAVLLAVFAADTSVHSVHHLTDPGGEAQCQALALSQPVAELSPDAPAAPGRDGAETAVVAPSGSPAARFASRPDRGRAPPLRPA